MPQGPSQNVHRRTPLLYGPNNQPIFPDYQYRYHRAAGALSGTLKNWLPKRFYNEIAEWSERERIVERSIDLTNNDPHASGVVDGFATTIVGSGLRPHPTLDPDLLPLSRDQVRKIQASQKAVYARWYGSADAAARMTFGEIQYLVMRSVFQYGEYLVLLHMIDDPLRPYALACHVVSPLRLKTPTDLAKNPAIKDGIELGPYGEPVAYYIKKSSQGSLAPSLGDSSANFLRIPARKGHRWNVLHGFFTDDPEQIRGMPFFSRAIKYFRDLNDYLNAELTSNLTTSLFSMFVEVGTGDPWAVAGNLATITETDYTSGNSTSSYAKRYQEIEPGSIMYGNPGEKPHPIVADRPGSTFEPFVKTIKKAIAMSVNIPYPVLFKDVENVNFAGFRSAMLDAWRVFMARRTWLGEGFCQKIWGMLMEEAYLRGDIDIPDFYTNMTALTQAEWRGSPKGDIEPIKAVQADILAIQKNLKTRAEAIAERGGDIRTTLDQLQEEQRMMSERGLTEQEIAVQPEQEEKQDE